MFVLMTSHVLTLNTVLLDVLSSRFQDVTLRSEWFEGIIGIESFNERFIITNIHLWNDLMLQ